MMDGVDETLGVLDVRHRSRFGLFYDQAVRIDIMLGKLSPNEMGERGTIKRAPGNVHGQRGHHGIERQPFDAALQNPLIDINDLSTTGMIR